VGGAVPVGHYDFERSQWAALPNGRIVRLLAIDGGRAQLDVDGSGAPASSEALAALQVTEAELERVAALYEPGKSLWRVTLSHFSTIDLNWPMKLPNTARTPDGDVDTDKDRDCQNSASGSIIECQGQALGESLPIQGTPYTLNYQSDRVPGRAARNTLGVTFARAALPASVKRVDLRIDIAGRRIVRSFSPSAGLTDTFAWDGRDAYGRLLQGSIPATVTVGYAYDGSYGSPAAAARSFSLPAGAGFLADVARSEFVLEQTMKAALGTWDAGGAGLGGWTLSVNHAYDPAASTLHYGDGSDRNGAEEIALQLSSHAGGRTPTAGGGNGDGGPATNAVLRDPDVVRLAPDGSMYVYEGRYSYTPALRRIDPGGTITTVATGIGPMTAIGPDGTLYGTERYPSTVWRMDASGVRTIIAGLPGPAASPATVVLLLRLCSARPKASAWVLTVRSMFATTETVEFEGLVPTESSPRLLATAAGRSMVTAVRRRRPE